MKRELTFLVRKEHAGTTVKHILSRELLISGKTLIRLKHTQGIFCNGYPVRVTHVVKEGDLILADIKGSKENSENIEPIEGTLDMVFENDDVIVINKEPNVPTHPSQNNYCNTLGNYLAYYFQEKGCSFVFRPVNRLDKNTSGLVLVAKNSYSAAILSEDIKNKRIQKGYLAIVEGVAEEKGKIEEPILRKEGSTIERVVDPNGQYALTEYERIGIYGQRSLLKIETKTGRTHQIRVHMAYIGHPVTGDFLYGTECEEISRHALHAASLTFIDPASKETISLSCELPEDMKNLLKDVKKDDKQ